MSISIMISPDLINGSALKYSGCMQVEHEEMERIIAGAEKDAAMNKIEINVELKKMSYCGFLREYDPSSDCRSVGLTMIQFKELMLKVGELEVAAKLTDGGGDPSSMFVNPMHGE